MPTEPSNPGIVILLVLGILLLLAVALPATFDGEQVLVGGLLGGVLIGGLFFTAIRTRIEARMEAWVAALSGTITVFLLIVRTLPDWVVSGVFAGFVATLLMGPFFIALADHQARAAA